MISIKKDADKPPQALVTKREKELKDAILNKNEHEFKSSVYRTTTIDQLETLYHHKCAYCETDTSAGAPLQVEHFRPKAGVKNEEEHAGYYWLAYEWTNLLLGCSTCNRNKGTHFPISGTRVYEPLLDDAELPLQAYTRIDAEVFLQEQAVLLNPEIDDVESYFFFLPTGEIKSRNERGEQTILLLKLNRERLIFFRKKLVDDYLNELGGILKELLNKEISIEEGRYAIKQVFKRIELQKSPSMQYSRLGYFMFYKFDIFFAQPLPEKPRTALLRFFELYKKGEL